MVNRRGIKNEMKLLISSHFNGHFNIFSILIVNINATVIIFSTNILLFIEILFYLTTPLTTINRGVLVNSINFMTKINLTNHFLKNRAKSMKDDYNDTEERVITYIGIVHVQQCLGLGPHFFYI